MSSSISLRDRLRALPMFTGELPEFDVDAAPAAPLALLVQWLEFALAAGVSQPHAMALATASADGVPSNRTLLLKDVDDEAVWFASLASSPKGRDLAANPLAALLLYWREQGRQVRITGEVLPGDRSVSEADFLQRHPKARASAIAGEQSEPISDEPSDAQASLSAAQEKLEQQPHFVPGEWTAYRVIPRSVEFWQAGRDRDQVRLRYRRDGANWKRELLWP